MKCDELKSPIEINIPGLGTIESADLYLKQEVDAAIAELKCEINRKDGVCKRWFYRCMEARTENVKLKRSLWLTRADRARCEWKKREHDFPIGSLSMEAYKRTALYKWIECERLCKAKAEKYK